LLGQIGDSVSILNVISELLSGGCSCLCLSSGIVSDLFRATSLSGFFVGGCLG